MAPIFSQFSSGGGGRAQGFGMGPTGSAGSQLYAFTSATFTSNGVRSYTGPSLSQMRSGMSGNGIDAWRYNTSFFNEYNGQQLWTVPADGSYRITAGGAGAWNYRQGGYGAHMRGDFDLVSGEQIRILVGQQPGGSGVGSAAGGTFVVRSPYNSNGSILVIAGGGGGGHYQGRRSRADASTGTSGRSGDNGPSGGSSGNGGNGSSASAGGGFFNPGGNGDGPGGRAYVDGGYGGNENSNERGGFGGGGTSGNSHGGGGGGYSGGGATGGWPWHGGGGGSYNSGSNQYNYEGHRPADGYVTIEFLG